MHPTKDQLSGYLLGKLPPDTAESIGKHLDECPPCQETIVDLEGKKDTLVQRLREAPPPQVDAAAKDAIAKLKPPASGSKPLATLAGTDSSSSIPSAASAVPGTVPTREQFLAALHASGIIDAEHWAQLEHRPIVAEARNGEALAKALFACGALTEFQAKLLYKNRPQGLLLGEYVILDRIGRGGMGEVFKARHKRMKRIVALKVMSSDAMKDEDSVKRFQREVEAAAQLEHPNIVTAYDAGRADHVNYLVMQFVDGGDLSKLAQRTEPLPLAHAIDYVRQAACGLAFAHGKGVVHRDIKPHNLLLDREGTVKILDMGLARIGAAANTPPRTQEVLTQQGRIMGTPAYMAPEQGFDAGSADAKADVYGLGCTLFELLTKKLVYGGRDWMDVVQGHRDLPIPSIRALRPDVPQEIDALFARMVAKKPEDRPTATEVIKALKAIPRKIQKTGDRRQGTENKAATAGRGIRKPPSRKLIAAGAAGFLLVALAVWVIIRDKEGNEVGRQKVPDGGTAVLAELPTAAVATTGPERPNHIAGPSGAGSKTAATSPPAVQPTASAAGAPLPKPVGATALIEKDENGSRWKFPNHGFIQSITLSPDNSRLLVAWGFDTPERYPLSAGLWNVGDGRQINEFVAPRECGMSGVFSSDGNRVVLSSCRILENGEVPTAWILDASTGRVVQRLQPHESPVHAVAISHDGGLVATGTFGGVLRVWNTTTNQTTIRHDLKSGIKAIEFSPDSKQLLLRTWERVLVFDLSRIQEVATWEHPVDSIKVFNDGSEHFSFDGQRVVMGNYSAGVSQYEPKGSRRVRLVSVSSGQVIWSREQEWLRPAGPLFSRDDRYVLVGERGVLYVLDSESGKEVGQTDLGFEFQHLRLSDDGKFLFSWDINGIARIWEYADILAKTLRATIAPVKTSAKPPQVLDTLPGVVTIPSPASYVGESKTTPTAAPPPAVAPFDAKQARAHQEAWAKHLGTNVETTNSIGMKFTLIPVGEFQMGSLLAEVGSGNMDSEDESPQHKAKITKPFFLGIHEVTQGQWHAVMNTKPWAGTTYAREGVDYAASYLTWDEAAEFCRKLSTKEGKSYRLPTEAEWEYACRAGTTTKYSFGDDDSRLGDYAWYDKSARVIEELYPHEVGQKQANAWGLYDMHGNVLEWCSDWYGKKYYGEASARSLDPPGPLSGSTRVDRGGSWGFTLDKCRSAVRHRDFPVIRYDYLGFRVALVP